MLREITEKEQPCECVNFVVTLMKVETTQTQCKCSTSPHSSQGNPTVLLCVLCMLYTKARPFLLLFPTTQKLAIWGIDITRQIYTSEKDMYYLPMSRIVTTYYFTYFSQCLGSILLLFKCIHALQLTTSGIHTSTVKKVVAFPYILT